ncbi:4407_t:CDS:2 [Ambispora gerdemannii]|uniref:4407_t:CDS:1 n=1 Tax=Ambispora gerdemannii TaxID=144530 RepID=A0A9N9GBB7_9GLOM|nr:4407_t:CDS:2 [Ambispora gerdemannii]
MFRISTFAKSLNFITTTTSSNIPKKTLFAVTQIRTVTWHPPKKPRKKAALLLHGAKKETEPANPPGEDVELSAELIDNPFSLVVNGQQTRLQIVFNNKGQENYTVRLVAGVLTNPDNATDIFTKLPTIQYDYPVPTMDHVELEYRFHSEFNPQDLDLIVFVAFTDDKNTRFEGVAYNSTIHIVEPEQSIFDLQLLFLYLILAGIIGGVGYMIFQAFFGGVKSKKNQKNRNQKIAEKQAAQAAIELKTYDESWIPEHHLKKPTRSASKKMKKDDKAD